MVELIRTPFGSYTHKETPKKEDFKPQSPVLIEGLNEFYTLCPVSKMTGHRDSPLTLLKMALSDKNSRLLDSILQELPAIQQMDISDEDKLSMLVSRLDTGSFAENDIVFEQLSQVADVLFPKQPQQQQQAQEQAIEFENADASTSDNVSV